MAQSGCVAPSKQFGNFYNALFSLYSPPFLLYSPSGKYEAENREIGEKSISKERSQVVLHFTVSYMGVK